MKYSLLRLIREKSNVFWILLFPIILGCLFKAAFSNIGASENFHAIPVAIVSEEGEAAANFCLLADELGKEGKDQMLIITYCEEEEALRLLEEKKIDGILYAGNEITLTISSNMVNAKLNQSILQSFVQQYNLNMTVIADTAAKHPKQLPALIEALSKNDSFLQEVSLSRNKGDTYNQYFYNLIAMACLFTAMSGIYIALENQGNLSSLAARKNVSPANKLATIVSELIAYILFEFVLNLFAFLFIIFVLRVDMTARLPLAILTIFISAMTSVTIGFFLGTFGPKSESSKVGMMFAIVMPCCFFSGLMVGDMRIIVETYAPFFNRINPAALISDSFYCLATYDSLDRYLGNILTLLLYSVVFCIGGFLLTRRKKYASL